MVFSIPSYLGVGDRYKKPVDARAGGATFLVSRPKTGHNPDALFEKQYQYMWNGDRDVDADTRRRREALESGKKNLTPNGFVYTSPTAAPVGLGSYFGCFESIPYVHMSENPEKHAQAVAKKELEPRGIYTSPPPRGSAFGFPNVTISTIGTDYIAVIYDQERINERELQAVDRKKMPAEPFRPGGREGYTFDENPMTGTSRCYVMTTPFQEKRPERVFAHFRVSQSWRPAGYVDDMPLATEHWEDPYGGYDPRKDPKDLIKKPSSAPFLPSSRNDSFWYTQSIVFKRI